MSELSVLRLGVTCPSSAPLRLKSHVSELFVLRLRGHLSERSPFPVRRWSCVRGDASSFAKRHVCVIPYQSERCVATGVNLLRTAEPIPVRTSQEKELLVHFQWGPYVSGAFRPASVVGALWCSPLVRW